MPASQAVPGAGSHVYRNWNYYRGFSELEIEQDRELDRHWRRRTKPLPAHSDSVHAAGVVTNDESLRQKAEDVRCWGMLAGERESGQRTGFAKAGSDSDKPSHGVSSQKHYSSVFPTAHMVGAHHHLPALKMLGVGLDASLQDVKTAYKALVKELHPDSRLGNVAHRDSAGSQEKRLERLQSITVAYRQVSRLFHRYHSSHRAMQKSSQG